MEQSKNTLNTEVNTFGFYTAILTALLTSVTFGIAILTPPLSGPSCRANCLEYPYSDIAARFPRDYLWMYPAILSTLGYVVLMVCIHQYATANKKLFSQIGLAFAIIAATTLIIDYFIQLTVIQPSLLNDETEGLALFTQYNPHGIFIALEELGYLMMSVSYLFMAFVFSESSPLARVTRWVLRASFILTIISLLMVAIFYGIDREYRFEIFAICINWFGLIIAGILLSRIFRKGALAS